MAAGDVAIGPFRLEPNRGLTGPNGRVPLGRKALAVLSTLAAARGALVTKDELMAAVWPRRMVADNALHAQITTLRRALGASAGLLETVHGQGYLLSCQEAESLVMANGQSRERDADFASHQLVWQAIALIPRLDRSNFHRALDFCDRAIARDPAFARAHATRGAVLHIGAQYGAYGAGWLDDAVGSAERAIALDPAAGDGFAIGCTLAARKADWFKAEDLCRRGIVCDPTEGAHHIGFATGMALPVGHLAHALSLLDRALELAPGMPGIHLHRALVQWIAGDREHALQSRALAIELGAPEDRGIQRWIAAQAAFADGNVAEAVQALAAVLPEDRRAEASAAVDAALAGRGDPAAAIGALDRVRGAARGQAGVDWPSPQRVLLDWFLRLGAIDQAMACAESFVADWEATGILDTMSFSTLWSSELRALRRDPRFHSLTERLGLLAFWRAHGTPDGHLLVCDRLRAL